MAHAKTSREVVVVLRSPFLVSGNTIPASFGAAFGYSRFFRSPKCRWGLRG